MEDTVIKESVFMGRIDIPSTKEKVMLDVLDIFQESVNSAYEACKKVDSSENDVVHELNIEAFNMLMEYSTLSFDVEKYAVFRVLKDMYEMDPVTFGHSIMTAYFAMKLVESSNLLESQKASINYWVLYKGYLMHDIGKLYPGLKDDLLSSVYSDEVKNRLKIHADREVVKSMMKKYKLKSAIILMIAISHHLQPHGKGYPQDQSFKTAENDFTEIASLADMIEAIMYNKVTNRAYKRSFGRTSFAELIGILYFAKGRQIDTEIMKIGIDFMEGLLIKAMGILY